MSVYVDPLMSCVPNQQWKWSKACHLYADSLEELHSFAVSVLGMKRSWFQSNARLPHYDLTEGRRKQAVAKGAIETDRFHVVSYMRRPGMFTKALVMTGRGMDSINLYCNATFPDPDPKEDGCLILEFRSPKGTGIEYLKKYFPFLRDVEVLDITPPQLKFKRNISNENNSSATRQRKIPSSRNKSDSDKDRERKTRGPR